MTRQNRCYRLAQTTHMLMRVRHSPPSGPWVLTHQKWHRNCWGLALGPSVQSCISQLIASCSIQPVETEIAPFKSPTRYASRCVLRGETIREWITRRAKASFSRSSCARLCIYSRCVTHLHPLSLALQAPRANMFHHHLQCYARAEYTALPRYTETIDESAMMTQHTPVCPCAEKRKRRGRHEGGDRSPVHVNRVSRLPLEEDPNELLHRTLAYDRLVSGHEGPLGDAPPAYDPGPGPMFASHPAVIYV